MAKLSPEQGSFILKGKLYLSRQGIKIKYFDISTPGETKVPGYFGKVKTGLKSGVKSLSSFKGRGDEPAKMPKENGKDADRGDNKETTARDPRLFRILSKVEELIDILKVILENNNQRQEGPHTSATSEGSRGASGGVPQQLHPGLKDLKAALVFGTPTEFNPSGIWVVEDAYNDADD